MNREIFINVNTGRFVNSVGATADIKPEFIKDTKPDINVWLYEVGETNTYLANMSSVQAWELGIDDDFLSGTPLMAYAASGDFDTSKAASGLITCQLDCTNQTFASKLGSDETKDAKIELRGYISGVCAVAALGNCRCLNSIF